MAKFIFKLQSLLNVKEKLEEQAKTEYGKAISKLEVEKQALSNILNQKDTNIRSIKEKITTSINPSYIWRANNFTKSLNEMIIKQKDIIIQNEQVVEEKRLKLLEAMKEKKVLETLKEKKKEEYLREELQNEQKSVDELVSYKYNKG